MTFSTALRGWTNQGMPQQRMLAHEASLLGKQPCQRFHSRCSAVSQAKVFPEILDAAWSFDLPIPPSRAPAAT